MCPRRLRGGGWLLFNGGILVESKMLTCLSGSWTSSDPPVAEDGTSAATAEAPWGVRLNRGGKLQREISSRSFTIF